MSDTEKSYSATLSRMSYQMPNRDSPYPPR